MKGPLSMHPSLHQNLYLVKEHVGMFKAANNFDIFNAETGQEILHCREDRLGILTKLFRFTDYKRMTPFDVEIRTPAGEPVVNVRRGVSVFLSKVAVLDGNQQVLGGFQQKLFSIGGAFSVLGANGDKLCDLKGKWTGWDFQPFVDATRSYVRGSIDPNTTATKARKRFPFVETIQPHNPRKNK